MSKKRILLRIIGSKYPPSRLQIKPGTTISIIRAHLQLDEKYLVLVHRGSASDDVLVFENDSMVQIFLIIWNNLKSKQDGDGKMASLGTDVTPGQRGRINKDNRTSRRNF